VVGAQVLRPVVLAKGEDLLLQGRRFGGWTWRFAARKQPEQTGERAGSRQGLAGRQIGERPFERLGEAASKRSVTGGRPRCGDGATGAFDWVVHGGGRADRCHG